MAQTQKVMFPVPYQYSMCCIYNFIVWRSYLWL